MALAAKKGSFAANTSTGNQAITGVGFQPLAVIFWTGLATAEGFAAHERFSFGVTTAAASRAVGHASDDAAGTMNTGRSGSAGVLRVISNGTPTVDADAAIVSLNADGFTINWTDAPASAWIIHYLALGGASLTNAFVGELIPPVTTTGNLAVTGVGFQPDCVLFFGSTSNAALPSAQTNGIFFLGAATSAAARGVIGLDDSDAVGTSVVDCIELTNRCVVCPGLGGTSLKVADFVSFDSDGLTLNWVTADATANIKVHYLALKGGSYLVGAETQKTSTGTKATTGVGFRPAGLFVFGTNRAASASWDTTQHKVTIGATDGLNQGFIWGSSTDLITPSDTNIATTTTKVIRHATNPSTVNAEAGITSLDSDGFTLDWTTADATAREFIYLAFGPAGKPKSLASLGVG